MNLVRLVRESKNLTPYQMFKVMRKPTIQGYLSLERKAKRICLEDLIKLHRIYGKDLTEFWQLLERAYLETEE